MKGSIEIYLKWLIGLTLMAIITPFVYLKIGPGGYEYYGPDVPDIYILGRTILGKDRSWWVINFSYKFQLTAMLTYLILITICYLKLKKGKIEKWPPILSLILLVLFPFWLAMYTDHVINNSDYADLTIYPHVGLLVYGVGLVLNLVLLIKMKKYHLTTKAPM